MLEEELDGLTVLAAALVFVDVGFVAAVLVPDLGTVLALVVFVVVPAAVGLTNVD